MFSFIMMSCGYVENCSTSFLLYGTEFMGSPGFETRGEAIRELALDIYAKYFDERLSTYENRYSQSVKECCRTALIADNKAKFCAQCGSHIKDKEFDEERFMEYVLELQNSTCDSYGEAEWAHERSFAWWPWSIREFLDAPRDSLIMIAENAEHVMLDALYDAMPELKPSGSMRSNSDYEKFKEDKQPSYR